MFSVNVEFHFDRFVFSLSPHLWEDIIQLFSAFAIMLRTQCKALLLSLEENISFIDSWFYDFLSCVLVFSSFVMIYKWLFSLYLFCLAFVLFLESGFRFFALENSWLYTQCLSVSVFVSVCLSLLFSLSPEKWNPGLHKS